MTEGPADDPGCRSPSTDEVITRLVTQGASTVLIDGRSGSGKSTLADQLVAGWPGSSILRLEDIYPGWDGLAWTVEHIRTELLEPRAAGLPGRWRQWDWSTGTASDWHTVEADRRVVIEGVGCLTTAGRALADLGIWVQTPDAVRKNRAMLRDGQTYAPHWDRWAAQEVEFIDRHQPHSVADYTYIDDGDGHPVWRRNAPLR